MEPMPGSECSSVCTTRRRRGTTEIRCSTRSTLSARSTESGLPMAASEMATMTKSKTLQGSRQKARPWAAMRRAISIVKMPRMTTSASPISAPQLPISAGAVSRPSRAALITINTVTVCAKRRCSTKLRRRIRQAAVSGMGC